MLVPISSKKHPGLFTQIDDEDAHLIKGRVGVLQPSHGYFYAKICIKRIKFLLSRLVMKAPNGVYVDHINHDTLDNRKSNLRICTQSENMCNSFKRKTYRGKKTTSQYKGVNWANDAKFSKNQWRAYITINGKRCPLGRYYSEKMAAYAYDCAAKQNHGEFASLNFSDQRRVR